MNPAWEAARHPYPVYLTGCSNEWTRASDRSDLGLLGTPAGSTWVQRVSYPFWAADNGCFAELSRPGAFKADRWLAWLERAGPEGCLYASVPDVVGDAEATWRRSEPFVDEVRALGFPVAVVLQDGLESGSGMWDEMLSAADCVFVGGSTEFKLGEVAAALTAEARERDLWVHVGRVNSLRRLRHCARILHADSADGTYLNFGCKADREKNTRRLFGWLDTLRSDAE